MSWGVYSQDEEREDDLGDVTDAFQTNFFEALKQKGIENYQKSADALLKCIELDEDSTDKDYLRSLGEYY